MEYRKHNWSKIGKPILIIVLIYALLGLFQIQTKAEEADSEALQIIEQLSEESIHFKQPEAQEVDSEILDTLEAIEQQAAEEMSQSKQIQPAELDPEILEGLEQKSQESIQSKQARQSNTAFDRHELRLDLPPDTVLATLNGEPLVYVDEFNHRARPVYGEDLFQARYQALSQIIDTKLVAAVAKQKGFEYDSRVKERVAKTKAEAKAAQGINQYFREISDEEALQYYHDNIEKFRQSDMGTRVLFVVKPEFNEVLTILKRIKNGEPISNFSFSTIPMPGSQLPVQVQEAIFHLEPGQITGVIRTSIGVYIAQLVERNNFNRFKVSIIVQDSLLQCQQILRKVKAGDQFESHVGEKDQMSIDLTELPEPVQRVVPGMELKGVSQPIATPFGYFLVKLQERWSDAEIISAQLIRVNSENEGNKLLARLKKGLSLEQTKERSIAGKDLPAKLREAAKKIKDGEYSYPIKTRLGYYLVKVEKRSREKYRSTHIAKKDIKKTIKAETVSGKDAYDYYLAHLTDYRKSTPEYFVDIILSETLDQAENILIELEKVPDGKHQIALFTHYQKDLKEKVSVELLPADCQTIARQLDPGQLSPVIATHLGYFILRLQKIQDPAYLDFEYVQSDIKSLLVEQITKQTKQKEKRQAYISVKSSEEKSLATSYYRDYLEKTNTVTDEEAEEWWQNGKEDFLATVGLQGQEVQLFSGPQQNMMFKKLNVLSQRHRAMINDLYTENDVVIYEHFLFD